MVPGFKGKVKRFSQLVSKGSKKCLGKSRRAVPGEMNESLQRETERLTRSWMRHEAAWLRDYMVAGVEDPRINIQSILTRQFLVRGFSGERFAGLMQQELRFGAVMNWLRKLAGQTSEPEEFENVLYALRRGADNAEGIEIPAFIAQLFARLPAEIRELTVTVPNYVERFLSGTEFIERRARHPEATLNLFQNLWNTALSPGGFGAVPSVLEPACGSASDYRFIEAYGMARFIDYSGLDLCPRNIDNARALFPSAQVRVGNVFEIDAPEKAYDFCIIHDLFEHLSIEGMQEAVGEVCRVTRSGLCVGFFQMDEIPEHVARPVEEYHWNLLSMARMKQLFLAHGFAAQAINIGSFLHQEIGCEQTHNPNAYTFFLRRS